MMTQDERWNNCGSWFFDERSDKVDDKVNGSNLTLTEIEAGSKEYLRSDG